MNKKNIKRIALILTILEIIIILFCVKQTFGAQTIDQDITIDATAASESENIGNKIFSLVRIIGIIASVVTLMIVGIQYMYASVEGKAEKKKGLIYYAFGAILVLGITAIAQFVYDTVTDFIG